jgi:hypothetical protein
MREFALSSITIAILIIFYHFDLHFADLFETGVRITIIIYAPFCYYSYNVVPMQWGFDLVCLLFLFSVFKFYGGSLFFLNIFWCWLMIEDKLLMILLSLTAYCAVLYFMMLL